MDGNKIVVAAIILFCGFLIGAGSIYLTQDFKQMVIDQAAVDSITESYSTGVVDGTKATISKIYLETQGCVIKTYKVPTDLMSLPFSVKRHDCNTCKDLNATENMTETTTTTEDI